MLRRMIVCAVTVVATLILISGSLPAAVPQLMCFQGKLTDDDGNPVTDTVTMIFRIYDAATGGTLEWVETQSNVGVTAGAYTVMLGSVTPITLSFNQRKRGNRRGAFRECPPEARGADGVLAAAQRDR